MKIEGTFGAKAYAWIVMLLILEIAILIYTGMFASQGLGDDGYRTALSGALRDLRSSNTPEQAAAAAASYQLVCEQESYSSAISVARPTVVFIEVQFSTTARVAGGAAAAFVFDNAQGDVNRRIGSGVIVDSKGYILTNHHVIVDAVDIDVTPFSSKRRTFKASVIRASERDDLALIKVDAGYDLPEATLGESDKVKVGDVVLAIGSPFGMEHTATLGIISDDSRSLVIDGHLYSDMFQTDAAINRGNSGGALVSIEGELIGINTAIFAPTGAFAGVGFAIPINRAKAMLAKIALVQPKAAGL